MRKICLFSILPIVIIALYSCGTGQQKEQEAETPIVDQESVDEYANTSAQFVRAGDSLLLLEEYEAAIENYEKSLEYNKDRELVKSIQSKIDECVTLNEFANSPIGKVEKMLIGKRVFGVQFIWDAYGHANVTKENGVLKIDGKQFSKDKTEYCKINGTINIIDERKLTITGHLELYTHGCCDVIDQTGTFNFLKSGNRKYWRWQDYGNYCSIYTCAYYLDIFE